MPSPSTRDQEFSRIVALIHPDPHGLLGLHPGKDGVTVRAFRPDAVAISVLPEAGGRFELSPLGQGLFEARLPDRTEVFKYQLEIRYPGDRVFTLRDPYSFLPTLGELDLHLIGEGRHQKLWQVLGAHCRLMDGQSGVAFAVWAPTAAGVSVVGDFNSWDGRIHPMRRLGASGVWELFVPEVGEGMRYKYEIRPGHGGPPLLKADPFAFRAEVPPLTASVVHRLDHHVWGDSEWMQKRQRTRLQQRPMSVYELHLGSWRHVVEDSGRPLTYREIAHALGDYVTEMGFTHVELMPISEHPFGGSWGYQITGYYAPTARFGHPDDLRYLIDHLHQLGVGVIVDWVPGHFPRDAHGLAQFDGTALYEHADPRQGQHPDWGTMVFNFGRNEVRNFLVANALFWLAEYHVDGLRVDAVASMLYLDYSRPPGGWVPNRWGGRENEEAIAFLRETNDTVSRLYPGVVTIAEESTAWPKVSRPTSEGGLGFHFKWNMGWMHDTLLYFSRDPVYRRHHHNSLTFGLLYAFSENFVLPLSHDEVVHGKGSLLGKMPGDEWQKFANLRALFAWMWAHPGKKLLFMGNEFGQGPEWSEAKSLHWHQLGHWGHSGVQKLLRDLNALYAREPALFEQDSSPMGFQWLQANAADLNVFAFVRWSQNGSRHLVCAANLSPVPRHGYRMGFPRAGAYTEVLNSDGSDYGGAGLGNLGRIVTGDMPWDGQPASAEVTLPPLSVVWFTPETSGAGSAASVGEGSSESGPLPSSSTPSRPGGGGA